MFVVTLESGIESGANKQGGIRGHQKLEKQGHWINERSNASNFTYKVADIGKWFPSLVVNKTTVEKKNKLQNWCDVLIVVARVQWVGKWNYNNLVIFRLLYMFFITMTILDKLTIRH